MKKQALVLSGLLGHKKKHLDITFVDDKTISVLNKKFMNKKGPTDVLSFPFDEKYFLGDIVISLDTAKKQALILKLGFIDHLLFLVIHGLLHLSGYDHKNKNEKHEMTRKEKLLSKKIGLNLPKTLWDL